MDEIKPGITGEKRLTVTEMVTARHIGSGGMRVFATPAMIGLMEGAAVAAIDHLLPEGQASVGTKVEVEHLAATPMGHEVRAEAEVIEIDRRRVTFNVRAWDEHELIGQGTHSRFVIDLDRFLDNVNQKRASDQ